MPMIRFDFLQREAQQGAFQCYTKSKNEETNLKVKEDQEHLNCEGYQYLGGDADLGNEEDFEC